MSITQCLPPLDIRSGQRIGHEPRQNQHAIAPPSKLLGRQASFIDIMPVEIGNLRVGQMLGQIAEPYRRRGRPISRAALF